MKKTVLIVEDERPLLTAIQKKLTNSGFETISTRSAEQALDYLNSIDETPDLIWLDYYLQGMNGIDFIKELNRDTRLQNIPIFVISNTAGQDKIDTLKTLGIKKILRKSRKKTG